MPETPPARLRIRRRRAVSGRTLASGIAIFCAIFWQSLALAAPDDSADAVTRLLVERGLLSAEAAGSVDEAPTVVQRMRDRASDMVLTAMNFLGVPYRRGGSSADAGFDCSGFTRHIFEMSLGLMLPRRVDEQASAVGLVEVPRDELRPGDLVFFNTLRRTFSHVGIYVGEGKFIHSPRSGGAVRVEDMRFAYWSQRFTGARRASVPAESVPKVDAITGR